MHPKQGFWCTQIHSQDPTLFQQQQQQEEPKESTPRIQTFQNTTKNLGVLWITLRSYCFFDTILPELMKYTQTQPKCTPIIVLVHPNPLTGPDLLSTTTTTTRRTQGIHPQNSNTPKHYKKPGRPVDHLTFIVIVWHDIARTAEIHTQKQPKCTPKKLLVLQIPLSGPDPLFTTTTTTTTTTRRTQGIHPQNSNPPKHHKKPSVLWTPLRL